MSSRLRSSAYIIRKVHDKDKSIKLGTGNLANLDTESEVIRIETRERHKSNFGLNCDVPLAMPLD